MRVPAQTSECVVTENTNIPEEAVQSGLVIFLLQIKCVYDKIKFTSLPFFFFLLPKIVLSQEFNR